MKNNNLFFFCFVLLILFNDSLENKNVKKTKEFKNIKKNRKLEDLCEDNLANEERFHDLNIYIDTLNIDQGFESRGLSGYKNSLYKAFNDAARRLGSFLKILEDDSAQIITETPPTFGINVYNHSMIFIGGDDPNGMFKMGYNFVVYFKFNNVDGDETDIGDNIAVPKLVIPGGYCSRPFLGLIILNSNPIYYSNLSQENLVIYMMQKFTQLLAFRLDIISQIDQDYSILENDEDPPYYIRYDYIVQYAQKYFNCPTLNHIEISKDINGNFYWPPRLLLGEYMSDIKYIEELVISEFTLLLLESLRYLKVKNRYTGGLMRFGKHKGCNFINKKCYGDNDNGNPVKFENEFYYPSSDQINTVDEKPSCSSGRQSKTIYKLKSYSVGTITGSYKYFTDSIGGRESTDYCPVSEYISSETYDIGHCSDKNKNNNTETGEIYSNTSFCALSSLNQISNDKPYLAICFQMFCSGKSLTIKFNDNYLVCPRKGGTITGIGFYGYLLCPDYNLICTGDKMCNSMFNCLEKGSEEKDDSFEYGNEFGYEIETTQDLSTIEGHEDTIKTIGWELDINGECIQYCAQCKEINPNKKQCLKCGDNYELVDSLLNGEIECKDSSFVANGYYKNNNNNIYYPCISHCKICSDGNTCTECFANYKVSGNNICVEKVENCNSYNSDDNCVQCKDGYLFVKDINDEITCKLASEIIIPQYYSFEEDGITYYKKCSDSIGNCNSCSAYNNCDECMRNYAIIDNDHTECVDLSEKKYYFDSSSSEYKLCSTKMTGCEKCIKIDDNEINCIECNAPYSLLYGERDECIDESTLRNDPTAFYDNNGLKYYSCKDNRYHLVNNCLNCNNKETCEDCKTGYSLYNSNKLCLSMKDIEDKLYYKNPNDNNYYLCSNAIKGCYKCNNADTCIECNTVYDLDENNKCVPTSLTLTKYYLDTTTGKYVSCSKIENCDECTSATQCTKCVNGYELVNNICQISEDNKTKAMATAAIVLSTIAIAASIVTIVLIFFKKLLFRGSAAKGDVTTAQNANAEEVEEVDQIVIQQSGKRSIHNTKSDS